MTAKECGAARAHHAFWEPRADAALAALYAALTLCGHAAGSAPAAITNEELAELRGRIQRLERDLAATDASRTEAADALKASEQAISEANRSLHALAQQRQTVQGELERLRLQSRDLEERVRQQRGLLEKFLRARYMNGPGEALRLLLNGRDPDEVSRQLRYLSYISRSRADMIQSLRVNLKSRAEASTAMQQEAERLARIEAEQLAQKRRLQAESEARREIVANLADQIARQRAEISVVKRDEQRLTKLVEEIAATLARRQPRPDQPGTSLRPAPQQAEPAEERAPDSASAGDTDAQQPIAEGGFEKLKGRLRLPVGGELTNRFGSPRSDSGLTWKGVFIRAREGEEVRAIASGRVVFADWLRGFGNLLIIDHGQGYMSLYGNNEALYSQVGDTIRLGQAVARVGNSGGNPESGLYFELRYQSRPLDPLSWVARK